MDCSPFLKINFDHLWKFNTEVVKKDNCPEWRFEKTFLYSTKVINNLAKKFIAIEYWNKKDSTFVATCDVDLFTIATGPVAHQLPLVSKNSEGISGMIRFEVIMEQICDVNMRLGFDIVPKNSDITVDNFFIETLKSVIVPKGAKQPKPTTYRTSTVAKSNGRLSLEDINFPQSCYRTMLTTLTTFIIKSKKRKDKGKQINDSRGRIKFPQFLTLEKNKTYTVEVELENTGRQVGTLIVNIEFENKPEYAQMRDCFHIPHQIVGQGKVVKGAVPPIIDGVELSRKELAQNAKQAEEQRQEALYAKKSTRNSSEGTTLSASVGQSKRKSKRRSKKSKKSGSDNMPPESKKRKHKSDKLTQSSQPRHRSSLRQNSTLRNPLMNPLQLSTQENNPQPVEEPRITSQNDNIQNPHQVMQNGTQNTMQNNTQQNTQQNVVPQAMVNPVMDLPQGWEMKKDPSGRSYYVDHINKKTQWEHPGQKQNLDHRLVQTNPQNQVTNPQNPVTNPQVSTNAFTSSLPTKINNPYALPTKDNNPYALPTKDNNPYALPTKDNNPYALPTKENNPYAQNSTTKLNPVQDDSDDFETGPTPHMNMKLGFGMEMPGREELMRLLGNSDSDSSDSEEVPPTNVINPSKHVGNFEYDPEHDSSNSAAPLEYPYFIESSDDDYEVFDIDYGSEESDDGLEKFYEDSYYGVNFDDIGTSDGWLNPYALAEFGKLTPRS